MFAFSTRVRPLLVPIPRKISGTIDWRFVELETGELLKYKKQEKLMIIVSERSDVLIKIIIL